MPRLDVILWSHQSKLGGETESKFVVVTPGFSSVTTKRRSAWETGAGFE